MSKSKQQFEDEQMMQLAEREFSELEAGLGVLRALNTPHPLLWDYNWPTDKVLSNYYIQLTSLS